MSPRLRRAAAPPWADRLLESLSGHEGLTDDLADDEAVALLRWLREAAVRRLAAARTEADGQRIVAELRERAKLVGEAVAARCYDDNDRGARGALAGLGFDDDLAALPAEDAPQALRQLLAWEDARHA